MIDVTPTENDAKFTMLVDRTIMQQPHEPTWDRHHVNEKLWTEGVAMGCIVHDSAQILVRLTRWLSTYSEHVAGGPGGSLDLRVR